MLSKKSDIAQYVDKKSTRFTNGLWIAGRWIRTTVGKRRQIYSLLPLATRAFLHCFLIIKQKKKNVNIFLFNLLGKVVDINLVIKTMENDNVK